MKRKVIAVDIDDVLGNSTEALRLEVNRQLGVNLLPEHYLVPDDYTGYYQRVWQRHGLAERMSLEQLEPFMQTNQSHVPANDKAFQTLKKLSQSYEFIVITSRPSSWRPATQQWLSDNFPGLFDKLLFTEEGERKTKGQLCVEHSAACLIDDNVEHAKSAHDLGVDVIIFGTYGWHHKVPEHFVRCKDWDAVGEYFNGRK